MKTILLRASRSAPAWLVLLASCSVFDESLIDEQPDDGVESLEVADNLSCTLPSNDSFNDYRRVDFGAFEDDVPTLPNCLGETDAPGNDTFFQVSMKAGEKWHFHVKAPTIASDPAIYVLGSCSDLRSCSDTYWGINACGDGEPEHFSFVAPTTDDFYVGIDGLRAGGENTEVFAVHAECGNGLKEHSEDCDDGNDDPLDGCHECHPVITEDAAEIEPNDGPLDPVLVAFPDGVGSITITSTFSSRCDFDFFRVDVPESTRLELALDGSPSACEQSDLELRSLTDANPFQIQPASADDACPALSRDDLPAGSYLIRVARRRELGVGGGSVSYQLSVALTSL